MSSPSPPDATPAALPPFSILAAGSQGSAQLPVQLTNLIARDAECLAVSELLRNPQVRLLTLTGPGGVGKTRLAIAAAREAADGFPDGVAFVGLAPIADPALVMPTIAWTLGLRDLGTASMFDHLVAALAGRSLLLLLDNVEQVVQAAPEIVQLLAESPSLTLLVTSRVRLRVSGEREFPVSPLPLSAPAPLAEGELSGAVRLFIERAQAVRPDFQITRETLPAVTEIVRRVDGLPLAIELAAARTKALTPAALLQRLEQRLPLLSGGARDLPLRQQTMRDAIGWSYGLLSAPEQELFRHLAVFAGGFTLEAAEALAQAGPPPTLDVLDTITALIEQSVIQPISGAQGITRYTMLETIREYALELLRAAGEEDEFRQRHAALFVAMAETVEPALTGPRQAVVLDRLAGDYPNIQAALTWSLAHDHSLALRLATALRIFWRNRGHLSEGRSWLERALASGEGPPLVRARAMVAAASICNAQSHPQGALQHGEAARAIFRDQGDRLGEAEALRRIAPVYIFAALASDPPERSAFARVDVLWEEELALRRELGDRHGLAWAQHNLGVSALHQGDAARAIRWLEECLPHLEALEDRDGVAVTLIDLGRAAAQQGDGVRAAGLFSRAITALQELGDQRNTVHLLEDAAHLALRAGHPEQAVHLFCAVDTLRGMKGLGLLTNHRTQYAPGRDEARRVMGEARYAAACETGRGLALEQAMALASAALAAVSDRAAPAQRATAPTSGLTRRELDVLKLLAEGLSDREIAEALFLSPRTVGWHVTRLLTKLDAPSRTAAAAAALRLGLV